MDSGYRGEVGVLVDNTERPISLNMKSHVIEKVHASLKASSHQW